MKLSEVLDNIPPVMYHATYRPLLDDIRQKGLGGSETQANYEDSEAGVVYLAIEPEVAESYAESSETVPEEWLDEIVVLQINTNALDRQKFAHDRNVRSEEISTLEYHGVIPSTAIQNL